MNVRRKLIVAMTMLTVLTLRVIILARVKKVSLETVVTVQVSSNIIAGLIESCSILYSGTST